MSEQKKVALVIGAGVATGGSVAKRFAKEGFIACMARRQGDKLEGLIKEIEDAGGEAYGYSCDATEEDQMIDLIEKIEAEHGPIEMACYNAAVGAAHSITDFPAKVYERVWRINTFGAFLMGREISKRMVERGRGTILYTGATSALRGKAGLAAFAGSGMFSLIPMPWSGDTPQVTVGSMSAALMTTTSSKWASASVAKELQLATAASHSSSLGE